MLKKNLKPLIVDLDGTLLKGDLLFETAWRFIIKNPLHIFLLLKYLLAGKASLKHYLAAKININPQYLPYNQQIIKIIKEAKRKGHKVVLATASNYKYAKQISEYLGLFDEVFASDKHINLTAQNKANKLIERYGENNFDYIGNS